MRSNKMSLAAILSLSAASVCNLLSAPAMAATRTWDGGGGTSNFFDVGSNWSDNLTPGAADTARFNLAGITTVRWDNFTGNTTNAGLEVFGGDVRFISDSVAGAPFAHTVTGIVDVRGLSALRLTNLILNTQSFFDIRGNSVLEASTNSRINANNLTVGFEGLGNILTVHNGGVVSATGAVFLGEGAGTDGTVVVENAGSSFLSQRNLILGQSGTNGKGIFTTSTSGRVGIGRGGVATAFAGALTVDDDDATGATGGNLIINNGSTFNHNAGGITQIAGFANHHGKIEVNGANSLFRSAGTIQVGLVGKGFLTLANGGKAVSDADVTLGSFAGATGTVSIGGGGSMLDVAGNMVLGPSGGVGNVTIASGGRLNIGDNAASVPQDGYLYIDDSSANGSDGGTLFIFNGSTLTNNHEDGIVVGATAGRSGRLVISGAGSAFSTTTGGFTFIGDAGTGILNISAGGRYTVEATTVLGLNEGSSGTVTVDGAGSRMWSKSNLDVTRGSVTTTNGGAILIGDGAESGGVDPGDLIVSDVSAPGSNQGGLLTIANGSTLTHNGSSYIGLFGGQTGRVTVTGTGSTWINSGQIVIGNATDPTSRGELAVENGGTIEVGSLFGNGANAPITVSSGGRISTTSLAVLAEINEHSSTATVTGANSTLAVGTQLEVAPSGNGTLNIQSAGKVTAVNAVVGNNATGVGTINLTDAGSLLDVEGDLTVGNLGRGTLNLSGGSGILVGDAATGTAELIVADSNLAGNAGGNVILNNNSTWTMNDVVRLGRGAGKYGALKVNSGSTFSTNSSIVVGEGGNGVINVTGGGSVTINTPMSSTSLLVGTAGGNGVVTIDGTGSTIQSKSDAFLSNGSTLTTTNGGRLLVGDNAAGFATDRLVIGDNNALGSGQGGLLTISGGSTLNHHSRVLVGGLANTTGDIVITGANSKFIIGELLILGNSGQGRVTISNGGLLSTGSFNYNNSTNSKLVLNAGGTFQMSAPNVNNALIDARASILNGYANGAWTGNGITSVTAQSDTRLGVGYAVNAGVLTAKLALKGDTNLSNTVDFDDLLVLAQNYNLTNKFWQNGDFNYDGNVNFDDLLSLAQNYNQTLSVSQMGDLGSNFTSDWALARSMVPEPTAAGALLLVSPLVRRRRAAKSIS